MNTPIEKPELKDQGAPVSQAGRRRFIGGLGAIAPVVMSVHSPSVLAAGQCLAPSAHASIALLQSRLDRERQSCDGGTPGYWGNAAKRNHTHHPDWVAVFGADRTNPPPDVNDLYDGIASPLFSSIFGSGFDGKKVHEVVGMTGGSDPYQLGAHLVAAYCNLKKGWVPSGEHGVLDLLDLQEMWSKRNSGYEPTAGVKWYGEQIVAYLQTTMLKA
jgi:hypothetical protein